MNRYWILIGGILGSLGVGLGAIGAHAMEGVLADMHGEDLDLIARRLANWKTAALYQMHHALAICLVGILLQFRRSWMLKIAGYLFLAGVIIFSGLLYVLVLTETRILGAFVPIGGTSLIVGWIFFALGGCCLEPANHPTQVASLATPEADSK
ncbi:MAG: DUF423 domain-containing protein [Planctomycetota bacterium]